MTHYIPTISNKIKDYPFLMKTCRKDYYKFKKVPDSIYDSLTIKSQNLYWELKNKEREHKSNFESFIPVIWSCIGFVLCVIGSVLCNIGSK